MKIMTTENVQEKIRIAVEKFFNLVCSTMGPSGRNIILHLDTGEAIITKDGVTVAKAIEFDEPELQIIGQILKQAAQTTNEEAGDGTTTSTCIASAVLQEGGKLLAAGLDSNAIRREIETAKKEVLAFLEEQRITFDDKKKEQVEDILYKIALISANGEEEVAEVISTAVANAGKDGLVTVEKGSSDYEIEKMEGMKVPYSGVVSYDFLLGEEDKKAVLEKCYIFITTYDLSSPTLVAAMQKNVFNQIMDENASVLIMSKKCGKGYQANMVNNNAKGVLKNAIVKAPYFGAVGREMMDDIAAYTDGMVIEEDVALSKVQIQHLGYAERVEVTPWHTTIYNPTVNEEETAERIRLLKAKAKKLDKKAEDNDKVKERLAALTGKVYNIKVPTASAVEDTERMHRIEDAINACQGALEHGYLPGGGAALLTAGAKLKQETFGQKILSKVCEAPIRKILENTGDRPDVVINNILSKKSVETYDARERQYGKAFGLGVIDSHHVISQAFSNGVSVGATLLTTAGIVCDKPDPRPQSPFEFGM